MKLNITGNFTAANSLRNLAKKYTNSTDPHTNKQGDILSAMADNILDGDIDHAIFRYHNLHVNVRAQLSFQVLELLGLAEEHVE